MESQKNLDENAKKNKKNTKDHKNKKTNKKQQQKRKKSGGSLFRNISIGGKYLIVFLISVALFLVATVIVYTQLSKAEDDVEDIIAQSALSEQISAVALLIEQQDTTVSQYITTGRENFINEFEEMNAQLVELGAELEETFVNDNDNAFLINNINQRVIKMEEIFTNDIINQDPQEMEVIMKHIELVSEKNSSVALINRLVDNVNEVRSESINKVTFSMANSKQLLIIINAVSIVIGLIIMYFVSRNIANHLRKVVTTTTNIAEGNLAVKQIDYKGRDEIGQISGAMNTLIVNIRNMIEKVLIASDSVNKSSEVLTNSSHEVKLSGEQMVLTMEELASGSETQANSASDLLEKMQQFVESVRSSQSESQHIATSTESVLTVTGDGSKLMGQSVEQMNKIDTIVSEAVSKVRGLDEQSREISQLVEVVKDIADQTNLLALNAAIEAARAGEHGQGFAVVAEEVRKLAEEVTSSVTEITNIVENIQHETNEVVVSLDDGYTEVQQGINQIEETGENFSVIDHSITDMVNNIVQIAKRLEGIAENSNEMNHLIEEIASISEEAAAGVEQSTASTQEISSSMDEVSQNAIELGKLAEQLNDEVNVFTIK